MTERVVSRDATGRDAPAPPASLPDTPQGTPGPWFIESHGIMDATRSRTICLFGDSDQDDADARLVAAAPQLLDALRTIRAIAASGFKEGGTFGDLVSIESIARHALREVTDDSL